jgi:hypothetical protein
MGFIFRHAESTTPKVIVGEWGAGGNRKAQQGMIGWTAHDLSQPLIVFDAKTAQ